MNTSNYVRLENDGLRAGDLIAGDAVCLHGIVCSLTKRSYVSTRKAIDAM